jgi:hypothetical protein
MLALTFVMTEDALAQDAPGPSDEDEAIRLALAGPLDGELMAQNRRRTRRRQPATRRTRTQRPRRRRGPAEITVPVNVAVGPTANFITGPVQDDQLVHTGLKFDVYAVLSQALIRQNLDRVPAQYKRMAANMTEARYAPAVTALIPHSLEISPAIPGVTGTTGIYGATWSPFNVGLALTTSPVRLGLELGLLAKLAYIHSEDLPDTFFARPGLGLEASLEIPFTDVFLISFGWNSQVYIPQKLGLTFDDFLTTDDLDNSIWHWGQAFVQLHFRFPYTTVM